MRLPGAKASNCTLARTNLELVWASGVVMPLIAMGGDRFAAGPTSTIAFARDDRGRIVSAARIGDDGERW